jgi:hypothetical protein
MTSKIKPIEQYGRDNDASFSRPSQFFQSRFLLPFLLLSLVLSGLILFLNLPGSFTQDSLYMLNEALTTKVGQFDEWYSPAYALLWKTMITSFRELGFSPFLQVSSMCILQTVLIVTPLLYLLRMHTSSWLQIAIVASFVILWPANLVYFGEIWRDVLMAALLLTAASLLDCVDRTGSRKVLMGALAVLFFANLIRQNAFIAELPLLVWAALLWQDGKKKTTLLPITVFCLFITFLGFTWSANRLLAASSFGRGASSIMYYDLMGISVQANELLLPKSLVTADYSLATVRAHYQTEYNDLEGVTLPATAEQMMTIETAWKRAVVAHPMAYARHRWNVTLRFLGISDVPHLPYAYGIPEGFYPTYVRDTAYYVRFPLSALRKYFEEGLSKSKYWFFRPWFYGLLAMTITFAQWKVRSASFWICTSGVIYWASCFVTAPSTDFRYSWWTILGSVTALALTSLNWRETHGPKQHVQSRTPIES